MGEIADDMIEGRACELCGQYFIDKNDDLIDGDGFPQVCKDCWLDLTSYERKTLVKSKYETL
jgi:hypothetical protein